MDFDQCACTGKTLGRLVQPAIVALLAEEPLHGYLLVQRLAGLAMFRCQKPDPTGVYRALRAMEKDGLVTSTWDLADNGPAKRRFELTHDGMACLEQWRQTLEGYADSVNDLLRTIKRAGNKHGGTVHLTSHGVAPKHQRK
jgi:DNA-binding PadR family transcriptional regulator